MVVVRVDDLVLLEGFQLAHGGAGHVRLLVITAVIAEDAGLAVLIGDGGRMSFDELDAIGVDNPVVLGLDSEVVGDELDRALVRLRNSRLAGAAEAFAAATVAATTTPLVATSAVAFIIMSSLSMHCFINNTL